LLASRGATDQAMLVTKQIHKSLDQNMPSADQRTLLKLEARLTMAGGNSNAQTAKVLEEIVSLDPLDGEALMLLGQHYSRENEPEKAMIYYERASSIDAFEANAKLRLAQLLVGLRRYADAVPLLRRVQELKPREDVARYLDQVERVARQDALSRTPKSKSP
jgi:tetratricopeptide (TPR) repeat protein